MKKSFAAVTLASGLIAGNVAIAAAPSIHVSSNSIKDGQAISEKFAYCAPDGKGKTKNVANISPQLSWSGVPKETKSFAVVVVDPDVPAKFDDANKEGKIIASDFPRQNFYHWVLINIPASVTEIAEGKGKDLSLGTALVNDFAGGKVAPEHTGYDGSCPPWNDERLHHYHFTVYALNVEKLDIAKDTIGKNAIEDIEKHALAKGELVGTYSNFVKK